MSNELDTFKRRPLLYISFSFKALSFIWTIYETDCLSIGMFVSAINGKTPFRIIDLSRLYALFSQVRSYDISSYSPAHESMIYKDTRLRSPGTSNEKQNTEAKEVY